jgi:hypothetical protein
MNGNGLIGSVAIAGAGQFERDFRTVVEGNIHYVTIRINFSASAGAATTFVVNASPEGSDDVDKVLGNGVTGLFGNTSLRLDGQNWLWQNLNFQQLRTLFGALLNGADFGGTIFSGATLAMAATAYRLEINVPFTLEQYFVDGNIAAQGSERIRAGTFQVVNLAPATIASVGSTPQTLTITSPAAVTLESIGGVGDPHQVGPTFHAERTLNFPNKAELAMAPRLFLADVTPVATNPVGENGYTITGQERFDLVGASFLGNRYKMTRLMQGGYDITARCTPLQFLRPGMQLLELPTPSAPTIAAPSATTLGFYDVQFVPRGEAITQRVAQLAGAGGNVNAVHPSPRSMSPGQQVPAAAGPYLPVVFTARPIAGPGTTKTTPVQAGRQTANRNNLLNSINAMLRR